MKILKVPDNRPLMVGSSHVGINLVNKEKQKTTRPKMQNKLIQTRNSVKSKEDISMLDASFKNQLMHATLSSINWKRLRQINFCFNQIQTFKEADLEWSL